MPKSAAEGDYWAWSQLTYEVTRAKAAGRPMAHPSAAPNEVTPIYKKSTEMLHKKSLNANKLKYICLSWIHVRCHFILTYLFMYMCMFI